LPVKVVDKPLCHTVAALIHDDGQIYCIAHVMCLGCRAKEAGQAVRIPIRRYHKLDLACMPV
jgi:hypothetical protein